MAGHEQSQTTCSNIQAGKVHNSISQLVELTTNNIAYSPAVGVAVGKCARKVNFGKNCHFWLFLWTFPRKCPTPTCSLH